MFVTMKFELLQFEPLMVRMTGIVDLSLDMTYIVIVNLERKTSCYVKKHG